MGTASTALACFAEWRTKGIFSNKRLNLEPATGVVNTRTVGSRRGAEISFLSAMGGRCCDSSKSGCEGCGSAGGLTFASSHDLTKANGTSIFSPLISSGSGVGAICTAAPAVPALDLTGGFAATVLFCTSLGIGSTDDGAVVGEGGAITWTKPYAFGSA